MGEVSGLVGLPRLDLSEFAKYWSSDHDHWSAIMMMMMGHSGEYGNGAKLVGKMSKSVMQLISIHF